MTGFTSKWLNFPEMPTSVGVKSDKRASGTSVTPVDDLYSHVTQSDESLSTVEDKEGSTETEGSELGGEKRELRETTVCSCDQWQTFPCDSDRRCPTCQTYGICPDCGGCRTCWWEGVKAGRVPKVDVESGWDDMPF